VRFRDLRWIGLKLLDARWIAADGMRRLEPHLQPVLNILGDFLEIFSKWYGATVPIAADYPGRARFARCQCFGRRWRPVCAENSDSTILVAFGLQKTGGRILTHVKNSLLFLLSGGAVAQEDEFWSMPGRAVSFIRNRRRAALPFERRP
jgi:hypothetical protein